MLLSYFTPRVILVKQRFVEITFPCDSNTNMCRQNLSTISVFYALILCHFMFFMGLDLYV